MEQKILFSLAAVSALGFTSVASAARNQEPCAPDAPAACYTQDNCPCTFCLGPENVAANAAVRPKTCNGDFAITVAGFYWNAHQDGMEYAVETQVNTPLGPEIHSIIDAEYKTPTFQWDLGVKLGLGWNSACDGWDLGVVWTWYKGKANDHIEAEDDDNRTLIPLWSEFADRDGLKLFATDIETHWNLKLNLIDIELGREFWNSKKLSLRPHVGLRIASIKQNYQIEHKGGAWNLTLPTNNQVDLDNDYKGVGIRAGLDSVWNFGCGWGLYGNLAASIVYGKFSLDHDEYIREASGNFDKTQLLESDYSFRASRAMLDLGLGIQWQTMFCDCQYALTAMLGWEHHLFFHQNQMWRVERVNSEGSLDLLDNTGENTFSQRRGDLDTQGWTFRLKFEF